MHTTDSPVLEIAAVTTADPDAFRDLQLTVHRDLVSSLDGYVASLPARRADGTPLFVDLIVWRSLEHAQRASESVQSDPRFAPYMQAMDTLVSFSHHPCDPELLSSLDSPLSLDTLGMLPDDAPATLLAPMERTR